MAESWKAIAARKQKERTERISREWRLPESWTSQTDLDNVLNVPYECGVLSKEDLRLTDAYDATTLVDLLASGKLKSVDVVTAFCKRAAIVSNDDRYNSHVSMMRMLTLKSFQSRHSSSPTASRRCSLMMLLLGQNT